MDEVPTMKILLCTQEFFPYGSGIGKVAYHLYDSVRKDGNDITVITSHEGDINLGSEGFGIMGILVFWYKVANYIKTHNEYDVIWMHNPLFDFALLDNVFHAKIMITLHTTYTGYYEALKSYAKWNFKRIYYSLSSSIEKFYYRRLLSLQKDVIITIISPQLKGELQKIGINWDNIKCIYNGYQTSSELNINSNWKQNYFDSSSKLILSIGRVTEQKNPLQLINFFNKLLDFADDIQLVFIGKEELPISKLNLSKNISFLGFISDDELTEAYQNADFYISFSIYEGMPLTAIDAASCGIPLILSSIPAHKHLLTIPGVNGILIDLSIENNDFMKLADFLISQERVVDDEALSKLRWSYISRKYLSLMVGK